MPVDPTSAAQAWKRWQRSKRSPTLEGMSGSSPDQLATHASPEAAEFDPAQGGGKFLARAGTGEICRSDCSEAAADPGPLREFKSVRDALAAGFRPCRSCRPLHAEQHDPEWLTPLLADVEADPPRRWHDEDLARRGLEPAQVRRWFSEHHGMTFHAYCRLRRLGRTLQQMQTGCEQSRALNEQGFDSEVSFRESFALVFGQPPSALDRESCIWINRARTPLGSMIMGVGDNGLYLLEFAERRMLDTQLKRLRQDLGRVMLPGEHPLMAQVQQQLDDYFDGQLRQFDIAVQAQGTVFQESVWRELQGIPYGQMRSYADVAHAIGQPEAVRAVGRANGDNRLAIVIPCHRVVGSGGELTGYGGGLWRKRFLLALEHAEAFSLNA